jgi:cysteine desulfurase
MGLAEAVRLLKEELPHAEPRMRALRDYLESELIRQLPNISINGSGDRVCNTSSICFTGVEGETLLAALDLAGIAVSHGSACSSGALEPSRVLLNMGLPHAHAASSIRFSLSRQTIQEEIDRCLTVLIPLVRRLR